VNIMSNNNNPNKNTALALDRKAVAGVDKYFATASTLSIAGTTYTPTALKAVFQADIDASTALDAGRAQVKQQVATAQAARAKANAVRAGLKAYVLGTSGAAAVTMLEDFGVTAPKRRILTVEAKAKSIANAKATRAARHTMGKKQKEPIKGSSVVGASAQVTPPKS
jgi:hypothetical protein